MTIFSLVFAFLLEQWHPVGSRNRIILASGTGALGVRLGGLQHEAGGVYYRPEQVWVKKLTWIFYKVRSA